MSDILDRVIEEVKSCDGDTPDTVYVNSTAYGDLCADPNFIGRSPSQVENICRVFGLDVVVVPTLEQELMVLDTSPYPTVEDYKTGKIEPKPL